MNILAFLSPNKFIADDLTLIFFAHFSSFQNQNIKKSRITVESTHYDRKLPPCCLSPSNRHRQQIKAATDKLTIPLNKLPFFNSNWNWQQWHV